jgi:hypothetical protein
LRAAELFDNATGRGPAGGRAALSPNSGIYFNDGSDGDFRGRTENVADRTWGQDPDFPFALVGTALTKRQQGANILALTDLAAAKGRISLKIDLPTDGDVYYFSKLGGADGVAFDADEKGRGLLHGALAVFFAAGAAFLLRLRPR